MEADDSLFPKYVLRFPRKSDAKKGYAWLHLGLRLQNIYYQTLKQEKRNLSEVTHHNLHFLYLSFNLSTLIIFIIYKVTSI